VVALRRRTLAAGALGALALGWSSGLAAAEARALRIVVPFPAGTGADAGVRVLAQPLAELFASYTQVRFGHIPQRSTAAAAEEVVAGSAHWTFSSPSAALPLIGKGQLRPIAITDARRNPLLPEVPTMAEAGVPRMEVQTWVGLYAPAGTPPPVVARLHDAVARLLALPAVRERLQQHGLTPGGGAPGRLAELASAERAKWRTLVRERRIVAPTPD
jgi:tripartite-type tricarboxylate transporter receptor subunit TctC